MEEDGTGVAADVDKTFKLLQRGDARGVFQLESDGIRELLKRMKPDNIRDLHRHQRPLSSRPSSAAAWSTRTSTASMAGRVPTYQHPVMEEILKETYGVISSTRSKCMRRAQPPRRHRARLGVRVHQGDQQEEAGDHRPARTPSS